MPAKPPAAIPPLRASPLAAGVLAGGQGRRLGGLDKGLQPFRGQALIAQVLAALRPQATELLISANRNQERYAEYGLPVLPDLAGAGPLAGLASLLAVARAEWLLCVPCDAPELPPDLGARLLATAQAAGAPAAYLHDGQGPQPTFCLVRTALAASALAAARQQRGLAEWLDSEGAARLHGVAPANLNRPEDFQVLAARP
jgi:molybdenum cofactor guanylyltransferase